jgi:exosortase/archaeosortase family protein
VALIAVATFSVLAGLLFIAVNKGWLTPWMENLAAQVSWWMGLLGVQHTLSGVDIMLSTRTLRITMDCTAAYIMAIYIALIVAYPFTIKLKAAALLIGLPVIYVANLVRLVAIGVISDHASPPVFTVVHDYFFEVAMVIVVLVLWATWLDFARTNRVSADSLWFWTTVVLLSMVIGVAISLLKMGLKPPYDMTGALWLAPALALILAARGASWRRKLAFVSWGVLGFALVSLLFELSGIEDVVWHRVSAAITPFISLTVLFTAFMIGWPLVMVILFVGRHPERLWTSPGSIAEDPASAAKSASPR